jgi:lysozyme
MMKTSKAGLDLIKKFEGLELQAYQDIAGIWTIGYGHTGFYPADFVLSGEVKAGDVIEYDDAEWLLRHDLTPRERFLDRAIDASINQNQFDALISLVYNIGEGAFLKSTALRRLNVDDREGAADAMTWFNKATVKGVLREVQGLTRRRAHEKALFLTPVPLPVETPNNPQADHYDENQDTRRHAGVEDRIIPGLHWLGKLFRMVRNIALNSGKHGERK